MTFPAFPVLMAVTLAQALPDSTGTASGRGPIQLVLVALFLLGLAYVFVLSRGGSAKRRLGVVLVAATAVYFILRPDDTTRLASFLGVGRGADLLVYLALPVLGFTCINLYIRQKHLEDRIHALTRELALQGHSISRLEGPRGRPAA